MMTFLSDHIYNDIPMSLLGSVMAIFLVYVHSVTVSYKELISKMVTSYNSVMKDNPFRK